MKLWSLFTLTSLRLRFFALLMSCCQERWCFILRIHRTITCWCQRLLLFFWVESPSTLQVALKTWHSSFPAESKAGGKQSIKDSGQRLLQRSISQTWCKTRIKVQQVLCKKYDQWKRQLSTVATKTWSVVRWTYYNHWYWTSWSSSKETQHRNAIFSKKKKLQKSVIYSDFHHPFSTVNWTSSSGWGIIIYKNSTNWGILCAWRAKLCLNVSYKSANLVGLQFSSIYHDRWIPVWMYSENLSTINVHIPYTTELTVSGWADCAVIDQRPTWPLSALRCRLWFQWKGYSVQTQPAHDHTRESRPLPIKRTAVWGREKKREEEKRQNQKTQNSTHFLTF